MAVVDRLTPRHKIRPERTKPSRESCSLLDLCYDYLETLDPMPAVGVCVCSSVAVGTATRASDIDLGVVVPDGVPVSSEKLRFRDSFIDHCEWPVGWLADVCTNPFSNPVLAYSLAYSLILYDSEGALANTKEECRRLIQSRDAAMQWVERSLGLAERRLQDAVTRLNVGDLPVAGLHIYNSVRRTAEAIMHCVPAGHCGDWPHRLRDFAHTSGNPWVIADAEQAVAPGGWSTQILRDMVEPIGQLHREASKDPTDLAIGCSDVSAAFFTRKASHYAASEDWLSLIHVFDRQMGYVDLGLQAKMQRTELVAAARAMLATRGRVAKTILDARGCTLESLRSVSDKLGAYIERARFLAAEMLE